MMDLSNNTIDILYVVDQTDSMKPHCDSILKTIQKTFELIASEWNDKMKINIGLLAYRDVQGLNPPQDRFMTIIPFTNDPTILQQIELKTGGGGDEPEDVAGALMFASLKFNWTANIRLIIHIADAPCHGKKFHNLEFDRFPNEIPTLFMKDAVSLLIDNNIDYHFFEVPYCDPKTNTQTDIKRTSKMVSAIKEWYNGKSPIFLSYDFNPDKFQDNILDCVSNTISFRLHQKL